MQEREDYISLFDKAIKALFQDALRIGLKDPSMALFLYKTIARQNRAARVRQDWEKRGVHVPPFMIVSITNHCNLACKGCYARAMRRTADAEMSAFELRNVIAEASQVGISIMMIAGGEPLTRPEILDITKDFPEVIFPFFTNGLLINAETVAKLKKQRQVIPMLSLEGHQPETDLRRGQGVYAHLAKAMKMLRAAGIFFGTSLTLTRPNYGLVTDRRFLGEMIAEGCRLFIFVEYVPVQEGTEALVLTTEQKTESARLMLSLQKEMPGLFISFPGDEEIYGGCLAAGRGFIHISPEGRVEPCPFSPFSDASIRDSSLKDALQSRLLRTIRENSEQLSETRGGCALWAKRDWVKTLVQSE